MKRVLPVFVLVVSLLGCLGELTVIQRSNGTVLPTSYKSGIGEVVLTITMTSGEVLKGRLTWIPPGGGVSTVLLTGDYGYGVGTGVSSGNKGMYIGTLVGDRGTTMRIELLCNAFTGKCVGLGKTNSGEIFDTQW